MNLDNIIKKLKLKSYAKIARNITNNIQKELSPVLQPLEDHLKDYIILFQKNLIPKHTKYRYLIGTIHIIHYIGVFLIVFCGFFLPPQIQIYIAIFYFLVMLTWLVFGRCILIILTNYIGGTNEEFAFPFKWQTMWLLSIIFSFIHLFFFYFPMLSPFHLLTILHNKTK